MLDLGSLFSNLLFFFDESPKGTEITLNFICIGAVLIVAAIALILCFKAKAFSSRELAFAGISIASGFLLSFIKVAPVTYGGSITLASMVPVILFTYFYGFTHGLLVGVVYGLLQFIQDPYILTPITFVLDYILPFACISLASIGAKFKNKTLGVSLSAVFVYAGRFLMHFLSGLVYFAKDAIWTTLPATSGALYSFLYQTVYLVPDCVIAVIALIILSKTGVIEKLAPKKQVSAESPVTPENNG